MLALLKKKDKINEYFTSHTYKRGLIGEKKFGSVYISSDLVFEVLKQDFCTLDDNKINAFLSKVSFENLHFNPNKPLPILTLACHVKKEVHDILHNNGEVIQNLFDKIFYPALLEPVFDQRSFSSEFLIVDHIIEQLKLDKRPDFYVEKNILRCFVLNQLKKRLLSDIDIIANYTPTHTKTKNLLVILL
ncbi:hypothetical protein HZS_4749 [Henneguya salminicola]|nr:hypothetical protein HZS_4749 [Henneguya salminicola]